MIIGFVWTATEDAPAVVSFVTKGSNLLHNDFLMTKHSERGFRSQRNLLAVAGYRMEDLEF